MADPMDDLKAMGEAIDQMDRVPDPEPAPVPQQTEAEPPAPAEESRFVGGIDSPLDEGESRRVTLDDIFSPVAKPVERPSEQEPAPEPGQHQSERDSRIKELTDQLAEERAMRNKLTEAMLQGKMPEQSGGQQPESGQPMPELDKDVLEWLRPYQDALNEQKYGQKFRELDEMRTAIQPLQKTQHDAALAQAIGRHVEGFKPEHLDVLSQHYQGLPDEDKAFYGDTMQGAALLARELVEQGKLKIGSRGSKGGSNGLSSRHTADIAGQMPRADVGDQEAETVQRINNLSSEQVRDLLDEMRQ